MANLIRLKQIESGSALQVSAEVGRGGINWIPSKILIYNGYADFKD